MNDRITVLVRLIVIVLIAVVSGFIWHGFLPGALAFLIAWQWTDVMCDE